MGIRTDLALEARELYTESSKETSEIEGVDVPPVKEFMKAKQKNGKDKKKGNDLDDNSFDSLLFAREES